MSELLELLKSINEKLGTIERFITKPSLAEVLCKSEYTCAEVAELSIHYGTQKYGAWAIRFACLERRIPDARKLDNGQWRLPREVVVRVLQEGFPPERRRSPR